MKTKKRPFHERFLDFLLKIEEKIFKKDEQKQEENEIANHLMRLIFKDRGTSSSIQLFVSLKEKFDKEIAKRGIDSLIEHTDCEDYFRKNQKELSIEKLNK